MEGITQSFELTGNKITAKVTVKETYDIAANTSDILVGVDVKTTKGSGYTYYINGNVVANDTTLVTMSSKDGTYRVYIDKINEYFPIGTKTEQSSQWGLNGISHDADGAKTITVSVRIGLTEGSGKGASGALVEGSGVVTLTQIPRASNIGATDADIGAVSMVAVTKKNTAYTHSVGYQFGSLSGYLKADGSVSAAEEKMSETSIAFRIPLEFYDEIPNAKSGVCTLTCRTYSGDMQIGDATQCTFSANVSADSAPSVDGLVEDVNTLSVSLTGNKDILVRYVSDALCTISASAKNGATISKKTIAGQDAEETLLIEGVALDAIAFTATDSRGLVTVKNVQPTVVPYVQLTALATGKRTDPTSGNAILSIKGNYYNENFPTGKNTITVRYWVDGTAYSITPTLSGNTYTAQADLSGLDYRHAHKIAIEVKDRAMTVTTEVTVDKGIPLFDWGENDFAFHVPVIMDNQLTIGNVTLSEDQLARLIAMLG